MMTAGLRVRKAMESDIDQIISVHREAFSGFYLDKMGPAFLRVYYECALANAGVISFVAVQGLGVVVGFVVGFKSPKSFYTEFKAVKSRLLFPIILAMFRRPSLLIPSLANIFKVNKDSINENDETYTELVSIGVTGHGKGIGSQLLREFINVAWVSNVNEIRLTTNRDDNDSVNQFYLKHGFHKMGIEYRNKRALNKYSLERSAVVFEEKI
jgi:ribosomal protein S18 acetylase RimI-like enzyme